MDNDEFDRVLETNDNVVVFEHYATPVKPSALPLLDVGFSIQPPANADMKEVTDSHDDVGDMKIEPTLEVEHDNRGEVAVATVVEIDDEKNDDGENVVVSTVVETDDKLDEDGDYCYDNANC